LPRASRAGSAANIGGRSVERHQPIATERRVIAARLVQRFGELGEKTIENEEHIVRHPLLAKAARLAQIDEH
jgi:hypothetical protein